MRARTVDRRAIAVFLAVTFGLAWAAEGVLALTGGLARPWAMPTLTAVMFTPLLGALAAQRVAGERRRIRAAVGSLRSGAAMQRVLVFGLIAYGGLLVVTAATMAVAYAAGWYHVDWSLPVLRTQLAGAPNLPPPWVIALSQFANIPLAGFTINALFAFGEEAGWRGWLLDELAGWGAYAGARRHRRDLGPVARPADRDGLRISGPDPHARRRGPVHRLLYRAERDPGLAAGPQWFPADGRDRPRPDQRLGLTADPLRRG